MRFVVVECRRDFACTPVTPLWRPGLIRQCYGRAKSHGIVLGCHSGVPGVWLLLGTGRVRTNIGSLIFCGDKKYPKTCISAWLCLEE